VNRGRFKVTKREERIAPSIAISTFCVKQPGPTDTVVTTATNPAGHAAVGQQSTAIVANRYC
jgi:hypothetical protein